MTACKLKWTVDEIEERRDRVAALHREGMSAEQIGVILGVSYRTVQRDRAARGISQPQNPDATPQQLTQARALLEEGASYAEAAATVGLSWHCLRYHFPGMGWTRTEGGHMGALHKHYGQVLA